MRLLSLKSVTGMPLVTSVHCVLAHTMHGIVHVIELYYVVK